MRAIVALVLATHSSDVHLEAAFRRSEIMEQRVSALPLKADVAQLQRKVRLVPSPVLKD